MRSSDSLRLLLPLAAALAACGSSNSSTDASSADVVTADVTADTNTPDADTADVVDASRADVVDASSPDARPDAADVDAARPDAATDAPTDARADAATDVPQTAEPLRIAYVAPGASGRPVIWTQRPDGTARRALSFADVTDEIPSQDDHVSPVRDGSVIGIHHLAWSPDGLRLAAVVSTAADQSEVVVLDVDHGGGYVASANGQYVMPALDWSPDGLRLAFVMSTQPRAGGLEVVSSDLVAHRWRFVTDHASLRGLSVRVRFDATAATVTWSRIDAQEPSAPWNDHSSLHRISVEGGAITDTATDLVGRVEAMRRDGAGVYLLRALHAEPGGAHENALVARTLAVGAESTLVTGDTALAVPGPHDGAVLVAGDGSGALGAWRVLRAGAADVRVDVPGDAEALSLWAPPAP